jgi:hypothetical protein
MLHRLVGAGVLCISKTPAGEIVLLLGKEREVPGWKNGSLKWCGFSGRSEEGETALMSAAREFLEESCSAVALTADASLPATLEEVSLALERSLPVPRTTRAPYPSELLLCHVTYLCRVPYDVETPQRFRRLHEELKRVDAVFKTFHRSKKLAEHLPRFFMPGFAVAEKTLTVDLRADVEAETVSVDFFEELGSDASALKTWRVKVTPVMAMEASNVSCAWREVREFVAQERHSEIFLHPAVLLSTHRSMLVSAYVNRCYLEKTELAWFRLQDLVSMERWSGKDDFRRNFLESVRSLEPQIKDLFDVPRHPESLDEEAVHA